MVFERFWRAENARTLPGSGLGLSIVKQATERHGGHVAVANHEPHGAVFTMRLPGQPSEITIHREQPVGPVVDDHQDLEIS
jgi:two-component system sensor histidine kinase MprB